MILGPAAGEENKPEQLHRLCASSVGYQAGCRRLQPTGPTTGTHLSDFLRMMITDPCKSAR
jgi:hypothetical protein